MIGSPEDSDTTLHPPTSFLTDNIQLYTDHK
jgi:hypothetical protein